MHICIDDVLFPNPENIGYNISIPNNIYKLFLDVCYERNVAVSFAYSTVFFDLNIVPEYIFNNSLELVKITQDHVIDVNNAFHGYQHDVKVKELKYFEFQNILNDPIYEFERQNAAFINGLNLFREYISDTNYFIPPAHHFVKGITDVIAFENGFTKIGLADNFYGIYEILGIKLNVIRRRWCGIYSGDFNYNFFNKCNDFDIILKMYKRYLIDKFYSNSFESNTEIVLHSGNLIFLNSKDRINKFIDLLYIYNY